MTEPKTPLAASDWAQAGLKMIAERGVDGLAVEPLARDLGVTKGSFYWHFNNREELIAAALADWETRETDAVLSRARAEAEPGQRIRRLISEVNASRRASQLYLALSTASGPALVRDCVARVSARRFEFLLDCYRALGLASEPAHHWALMTFSIYLGSLQVRRDIGDEWPASGSTEFTDYVGFLMDQLVPEAIDDPDIDDDAVAVSAGAQ